MYASLYRSVCACVSHCGDISIGRPILSSLRVDFKGEEISAGFSRLVNSLSPESGVFSTCVCVYVCVTVFVCTYMHLFVWLYAYIDCQNTDVWLIKMHLL